jgi:hypothetical protein
MKARTPRLDARLPGGEATSDSVTVDLTAVIVAVTAGEPRILTVGGPGGPPEALPSGPLAREHRTLEQGLRAWVEARAGQSLGYVEQLYSFGDLDRQRPAAGSTARILSVGYLALVREPRSASGAPGIWRDWYRYFPWEDWRAGRPEVLARTEPVLAGWAEAARTAGERHVRRERLAVSFGFGGGAWSEDRVLERYELAYEVGLVAEAHRDGKGALFAPPEQGGGMPMQGDHRRILATAIARLRGKIKYRPVVFELMPQAFSLLQLQQTVEALAGLRLHKPNFRRLVEQQGLVEETGAVTLGTGGRPARLVRFRREALHERPAPGLRVRPSGGAKRGRRDRSS